MYQALFACVVYVLIVHMVFFHKPDGTPERLHLSAPFWASVHGMREEPWSSSTAWHALDAALWLCQAPGVYCFNILLNEASLTWYDTQLAGLFPETLGSVLSLEWALRCATLYMMAKHGVLGAVRLYVDMVSLIRDSPVQLVVYTLDSLSFNLADRPRDRYHRYWSRQLQWRSTPEPPEEGAEQPLKKKGAPSRACAAKTVAGLRSSVDTAYDKGDIEAVKGAILQAEEMQQDPAHSTLYEKLDRVLAYAKARATKMEQQMELMRQKAELKKQHKASLRASKKASEAQEQAQGAAQGEQTAQEAVYAKVAEEEAVYAKAAQEAAYVQAEKAARMKAAKAEAARVKAARKAEKEAAANAELDEDLCVVCDDMPKCIAFAPCGHVCVCASCSPKLPKGSACPLCRATIESTLKIYM
eukprot:TRINITY_DN13658_c0_g1_i1.p1 TRINITY_DN13658_c0_g1~~TRINITY_DN13658_c0_g1_i1.p1  ORF type:complete len:414 (-),score=131.74 TRINITY_DN13658_c0_g1_i1:203-1444(-)